MNKAVNCYLLRANLSLVSVVLAFQSIPKQQKRGTRRAEMRGRRMPTNCTGSQKLPASEEVRNVHDEITDEV